MQREMVVEGRLECIHRRIRPHSTPRSVCLDYDFGHDSRRQVAVVDAGDLDYGQVVKTWLPICVPSSCVPSASLSPAVFSSLPPAFWNVCL